MKYKIMLLICVGCFCLGIIGCKNQKGFEKNQQEEIFSEIMTEEVIHESNTYPSLNVATYLTKAGDFYFINDCYHDQIIYHDNLTDPLTEWKVLTNEVHYAHTLAGDGHVLLADDTENNRVVVFSKCGKEYTQTQIIENVGLKPHYVQYDEKRETFYVWSSITGELYSMKRQQGTNNIYIEEIRKIDELYGVYVRSFTILGDDIYFVSGHNNQKIIKVNLDTFSVEESYPVSGEIAGMVQLSRIQDYFYITISTDNQENQDYATIIRTKDLHALADGVYEDIYEKFGVSRGTPYYINQIGDTYYMAHHRTNENIIAFRVEKNEIVEPSVVY